MLNSQYVFMDSEQGKLSPECPVVTAGLKFFTISKKKKKMPPGITDANFLCIIVYLYNFFYN